MKPFIVVAGPACALIAAEPDLGTTLVVASTVTALLFARRRALEPHAALAGARRRASACS